MVNSSSSQLQNRPWTLYRQVIDTIKKYIVQTDIRRGPLSVKTD